jgi:hypothetical protein
VLNYFQALSKYSEIITGNKILRDRIDSRKMEKQMYDGIFKKKEREIATIKKEMARIVEESNYAYEARYSYLSFCLLFTKQDLINIS